VNRYPARSGRGRTTVKSDELRRPASDQASPGWSQDPWVQIFPDDWRPVGIKPCAVASSRAALTVGAAECGWAGSARPGCRGGVPDPQRPRDRRRDRNPTAGLHGGMAARLPDHRRRAGPPPRLPWTTIRRARRSGGRRRRPRSARSRCRMAVRPLRRPGPQARAPACPVRSPSNEQQLPRCRVGARAHFVDMSATQTDQSAVQIIKSLKINGEVLVWRAGRLDLAALQDRLRSGPTRVRQLAAAPAAYVVFDLLAQNGKDLRDRPYARRRRKQEKLVAGGLPPGLVLAPTTTDPGWPGSGCVATPPPASFPNYRPARAITSSIRPSNPRSLRWSGPRPADRSTDRRARPPGLPAVRAPRAPARRSGRPTTSPARR
jgi:ATP dependent DNA ligase domain